MLRSINVSHDATPNRPMRATGKPLVLHNSWERGIASEDRGHGFRMPYLDSSGAPVGVKDFAEQRNLGRWDHPGKKVSS